MSKAQQRNDPQRNTHTQEQTIGYTPVLTKTIYVKGHASLPKGTGGNLYPCSCILGTSKIGSSYCGREEA